MIAESLETIIYSNRYIEQNRRITILANTFLHSAILYNVTIQKYLIGHTQMEIDKRQFIIE